MNVPLTRRRLLIGSVLAGGGIAGSLIPAVARPQYRPGQPEVLTPEPPPIAQDALTEAAIALQPVYARAGRPRVALFWNVELTDQLEDNRSERLRMVDEYTERKVLGEASGRRVIESGIDTRVSVRGRRASPLSEHDEWILVSAFEAGVRAGGVRLVDRAAILRLTSARAGGGGDSRLTETKSLLERADLMLELLLTPDAESLAGVAFRGVVRDIGSGTVLGSFHSRAKAAPSTQTTTGFRPTASGFERVHAEQANAPEASGRALSIDTLRAMATALSGWGRPVAEASGGPGKRPAAKAGPDAARAPSQRGAKP